MRRVVVLVSLLLAGTAGAAVAIVHPGDTAPAFTKNELDAPPPAARTLSQYGGKVVVLFLLGYS